MRKNRGRYVTFQINRFDESGNDLPNHGRAGNLKVALAIFVWYFYHLRRHGAAASFPSRRTITEENIIASQNNRTRVNDEIRVAQVRVVDPEGNHGIYPVEDALAMANRQELDLVEIAPDADPPVCKIMDYGKFLYEQNKREKEQKKRQHQTQLKEVRFRPRTDTHDFNFKTKHAREFLEHGNKVRAYVQFRGRDIIYKDQGMDVLRRFIEELQDVAKIDQPPRMEGRRMTTILAPAKVK